MRKIDLQNKEKLLFIDTETIGSIYLQDSVYPFEIGAKVYDIKTNKILFEKSYIVRKFFNNKYIMLSSFSGNKYPEYLTLLDKDKRYKILSVKEISKDINRIIKKYNIDIMVAHNGRFDQLAIDRLFNEFGIDNPLKNIDLLDTMEISKVITFSKDYKDFCIKHKDILNDQKQSNFITNSGRVRTTAQAIYCYISNNPHFQEAHTGLEDIDIELAIFKESLNRLGNTIVNLNTSPSWQDYSKVIDTD